MFKLRMSPVGERVSGHVFQSSATILGRPSYNCIILNRCGVRRWNEEQRWIASDRIHAAGTAIRDRR